MAFRLYPPAIDPKGRHIIAGGFNHRKQTLCGSQAPKGRYRPRFLSPLRGLKNGWVHSFPGLESPGYCIKALRAKYIRPHSVLLTADFLGRNRVNALLFFFMPFHVLHGQFNATATTVTQAGCLSYLKKPVSGLEAMAVWLWGARPVS